MTAKRLTVAEPGLPPDTRTTLLEAASRLIEGRGIADVTLADIASAAGVSRQTVYLHFGNRAGLLAAVARHLDFKSLAVREMPMAVWEAHSKAGFERFIRLWFKHVAAIFPVAHAIEAAAKGDADARAAWEERMNTLRRVMRMMVDGLAESGQLAARWTRQEATDWFWSRTHMDVWSHLAVDRGWPAERVIERVIDSLWSDLVETHQKAI